MEPDNRRLKDLLKTIINKNSQALGFHTDGIMYQGTWFPDPETGSTARSPRVLPNEAVLDDMETYQRQLNKLNDDRDRLKQGLHQLLKSCKTIQDIRDALPESIVNLDCLSNLCASLPRTRPEGYTLANSDRAKRQYEQILDNLKIYSVSGLFY